jgi:hypothetical protein
MYDILSLLTEARQMVAKKGFAAITSQRMSTDEAVCCHTLGLAAQGLPDLVVYVARPDGDMAAALLNELANLQISQGRFTHGRKITSEFFNEGSNMSLTLLEVDPQHLETLFPLNKALFGDKPFRQEGIQITFPDALGRFPWESGSLLSKQTLLGRAPE